VSLKYGRRDCVYIAFCRLEIVGFDTYAYPEGLKQKILDISETGTVQEICLYNVLLGKLFAEAAKRVCVKCGVLLESVLVIGSHGYVLVCVESLVHSLQLSWCLYIRGYLFVSFEVSIAVSRCYVLKLLSCENFFVIVRD